MIDTFQVDKFGSRYRICLKNDCHFSKKSTACSRQQMYYHILKIQNKDLIQIVDQYNLARFPFVLGRRTLVNLITDYTVEDIADEIINGGVK